MGLRTLRNVGATFGRQVPPLSPARTRRMLDVYRRRFAGPDGRVPATYRVLYAVSEPVS